MYAVTDDVTKPYSEYEWTRLWPRVQWRDKYSVYRSGCWLVDFTSLKQPDFLHWVDGFTNVVRLEFKPQLKPGANLEGVPLERRTLHVGLYDSKDTSMEPHIWHDTHLGHILMGYVRRSDLRTSWCPWIYSEKHFWHQQYVGKNTGTEEEENTLTMKIDFPRESFFIKRDASYQTPWCPSAMVAWMIVIGGVANLANLFNVCFPLDGPRRVGILMQCLTCCLVDDAAEGERSQLNFGLQTTADTWLGYMFSSEIEPGPDVSENEPVQGQQLYGSTSTTNVEGTEAGAVYHEDNGAPLAAAPAAVSMTPP